MQAQHTWSWEIDEAANKVAAHHLPSLRSDRGDILTDTPQAVAANIKKVVNKDRDVVLVTAAPPCCWTARTLRQPFRRVHELPSFP